MCSVTLHAGQYGGPYFLLTLRMARPCIIPPKSALQYAGVITAAHARTKAALNALAATWRAFFLLDRFRHVTNEIRANTRGWLTPILPPTLVCDVREFGRQTEGRKKCDRAPLRSLLLMKRSFTSVRSSLLKICYYALYCMTDL